MAATTGYAVSAISDLQAISSSTLTDGYIKAVTTKGSWYVFRASSTLTPDGDIVIAPSSGTGQWLKMYQTGNWDTLTVTTTSLAIAGTYSNTFPCPSGFLVTNLSTNYPARVRIYLNGTYASADASRDVNTELTGEHGCLIECVTISGTLDLDLSPAVVFYCTASPPTLYLTLDNMDTVSRTITLTMTIKNL